MLVLLPPSETKRPGGTGPSFDDATLVADDLLRQRRDAVVDALVALSGDEDEAARVLKLGAKLRGEIAVNAALRTSPGMASVDRYTGVLYDALDAGSLDGRARAWLGGHVWIHSAPFGPVGALDTIPAYRLGAGTSVPGLGPLRRHWAQPVSAAIASADPSYVLDLRSEAYAALGPVPDGISGDFVRVVTRGADGEVRALNHFNKHAKGALVRALASEAAAVSDRASFLGWASRSGVDVDVSGEELRLVV